MKILDTAINLRGPIEEEKDKDMLDVNYFTDNLLKLKYFFKLYSRKISIYGVVGNQVKKATWWKTYFGREAARKELFLQILLSVQLCLQQE